MGISRFGLLSDDCGTPCEEIFCADCDGFQERYDAAGEPDVLARFTGITNDGCADCSLLNTTWNIGPMSVFCNNCTWINQDANCFSVYSGLATGICGQLIFVQFTLPSPSAPISIIDLRIAAGVGSNFIGWRMDQVFGVTISEMRAAFDALFDGQEIQVEPLSNNSSMQCDGLSADAFISFDL